MPKHLGTNPNPNHSGSTSFLLVASVLLAILEPDIVRYIDPSLNPNPIPEYKLQLRTPPVLGFPRTQTGGADFRPKAAIKAAASCLKCILWFNVFQDE